MWLVREGISTKVVSLLTIRVSLMCNPSNRNCSEQLATGCRQSYRENDFEVVLFACVQPVWKNFKL